MSMQDCLQPASTTGVPYLRRCGRLCGIRPCGSRCWKSEALQWTRGCGRRHVRPRRNEANRQVNHIGEVKPEAYVQRGAPLAGEDGEPARHQVTELPRIVPVVTAYRLLTHPD